MTTKNGTGVLEYSTPYGVRRTGVRRQETPQQANRGEDHGVDRHHRQGIGDRLPRHERFGTSERRIRVGNTPAIGSGLDVEEDRHEREHPEECEGHTDRVARIHSDAEVKRPDLEVGVHHEEDHRGCHRDQQRSGHREPDGMLPCVHGPILALSEAGTVSGWARLQARSPRRRRATPGRPESNLSSVAPAA